MRRRCCCFVFSIRGPLCHNVEETYALAAIYRRLKDIRITKKCVCTNPIISKEVVRSKGGWLLRIATLKIPSEKNKKKSSDYVRNMFYKIS